MTEESWGPWIEHDGGAVLRGVRVGDFLDVVAFYEGRIRRARRWFTAEVQNLSVEDESDQWIIRYRIRKPKALQQLREIAENVKEDA